MFVIYFILATLKYYFLFYISRGCISAIFKAELFHGRPKDKRQPKKEWINLIFFISKKEFPIIHIGYSVKTIY